MPNLRNAKLRVCSRLSAWKRGRATVKHTATMNMTQMISALHSRQLAGRVTSLRQLHKICDLSQPEALTAITELEDAGIVLIKRNVADAFESTVVLTQDARERLDRVADPETTEAMDAAA